MLTESKTSDDTFMILSVALAVIFIWFGGIKYTGGGASGIEGLVNNSPILSWVYGLFNVRSFGALLGTVEIIIGILLLLGIKNLKLRAIGSLAAISTFAVTLTFLFTTPGVVPEGASFPILSGMPGEFLLKDIVLLAVSYVLFSSAKHALRNSTH
ncbi:Uncharacterized membrane protein YkgB [Sulfitobacter brevis]|uniref:Uncharacterized membrane protein YkgB n=1 Tax=Sulfitobacter brevis TaxID=74348 RepID=A0A1I2HKX4_9RHOB|nr:DUF417 family protein [Sulfitobacter brevis]SFF30158.1 Uncharacterized membrane protein YkgB [Sulfitobacter brevis]